MKDNADQLTILLKRSIRSLQKVNDGSGSKNGEKSGDKGSNQGTLRDFKELYRERNI